jgi:CxxC motif-containing protein
MGCYLTVNYEGTKIGAISGNRCKVGLKYARKELSNPERTLTTTVKVRNGQLPLVSVRTNKPIPKSCLFEAMALLSKVEVEAPIKIGEPIVESIFGTGINIVATKNVSLRNSAFTTTTRMQSQSNTYPETQRPAKSDR